MTGPVYDISIVGQGMVAWCLAHALRSTPHRTALITATPLQQPPSTAYRGIALSAGSIDLLHQWGMGAMLAALNTQAIQHIHVSTQGHPHTMRLDAHAMGQKNFGQVVNAIDLQNAWQQSWQQQPGHHIQDTVKHFTEANGIITLHGERHQTQSRVVIICDGQQSDLLSKLGLHQQRDAYHQQAHAATVAISQAHQGMAIERFLNTGPLALLPTHHPQQMAMVWTLPDGHAALWSPADWDKQLQTAMGYRMGTIRCLTSPVAFPLQRMRTRPLTQPGFVLMGNSASLCHPAAGQGLNLALRDIGTWLRCLEKNSLQDINALFADYESKQQQDHQAIGDATHVIAKFFSQQHWNASMLGNSGLLALDALPGLKKWLATRAMGYQHLPLGENNHAI